MMNPRMESAINDQINAEYWSAYLYESMSQHFAAQGLSGMSNWYHIQFQEEQEHALKFMRYIVSRGGRARLLPLAEVKQEWATPLAAMEDTLAHEKVVTQRIEDLHKMARELNDVATESMLKWYIDEQVEEEETAQGLIDQLRMIGDNGYGLLMLDKDMAARTFVSIFSTQAA